MKCSKHSENDRSMKLKLLLPAVLAALLFAIACTDAAKPPTLVAGNTNGPAPSTPPANAPANAAGHGHDDAGHDAPRISLADAKKAYDAGEAVMVDVRGADAFKFERIKGAVNIPIGQIEANMDKIPKGKKIIVYCS